MLSDHVAQEMAADFVAGWANEARNDLLGIIESFDLEAEDADAVMAWVDQARVIVIFPTDEEV